MKIIFSSYTQLKDTTFSLVTWAVPISAFNYAPQLTVVKYTYKVVLRGKKIPENSPECAPRKGTTWFTLQCFSTSVYSPGLSSRCSYAKVQWRIGSIWLLYVHCGVMDNSLGWEIGEPDLNSSRVHYIYLHANTLLPSAMGWAAGQTDNCDGRSRVVLGWWTVLWRLYVRLTSRIWRAGFVSWTLP